VVAEPAREILAEQRATGGTATAELDPARFVELLLERSIEKHRAASREAAPTMFDRAVPDCIAYAEQLEVDPEPSRLAAATIRYAPRILVLEPWEAIYTTDDERRMPFEATIPFHERIVSAYETLGYEAVIIPRVGLSDRVAFVLEELERARRDASG